MTLCLAWVGGCDDGRRRQGAARALSVVSTDLAAGDTVVLYTDGITDVRPPHDLSPEALHAIVDRAAADADSATEVAKRLGRELSAILPIAERNDDIALLVLNVPSRS